MMRKLSGLLILMAAVTFMSAQDVPVKFTYTNSVLTASTGTVVFAANPNRLWVSLSAQALTNDVYMVMTNAGRFAVKVGKLLKFTQFTNSTSGMPANPEFTFPVSVVGYGSIFCRPADAGATPTLSGTDASRR